MTLSAKTVALAGVSLLLLGASLETAAALPAAPLRDGARAAGVDPVAYRSPSSRGLRSTKRCAQKPSRC